MKVNYHNNEIRVFEEFTDCIISLSITLNKESVGTKYTLGQTNVHEQQTPVQFGLMLLGCNITTNGVRASEFNMEKSEMAAAVGYCFHIILYLANSEGMRGVGMDYSAVC